MYKMALLMIGILAVSPFANAAESAVRTVTVSGQGEIQAEPDKAIVLLGIESRRPKLEEARAEGARVFDAAMKHTRSLKSDQSYGRATRINVQPDYTSGNPARERPRIGYDASRQIEVDLRELDMLA